jgi:hypothetical protein
MQPEFETIAFLRRLEDNRPMRLVNFGLLCERTFETHLGKYCGKDFDLLR